MEENATKGKAETPCERRKDVGVYLKKITERLQAYADKQGFNHDITYAQGKVLFFLHTHAGGECSMKEIETYLDVSHATVSGIISRLAEKGYVMREKSKTDSRAKTVRLTEKEYASFDEMKRRRAELETMLLKGFSENEKETMRKNLERIYNNVREATDELPQESATEKAQSKARSMNTK